jgi:uncharacterized protein
MNVRRGAIAFVAIALLASSALALDIPPKPTQWVNDYGTHTLNDSQVQQLNEKLEALYKRTAVQFLIMIFPSLEGEDDLGYTNKVANVWKVKDDKALMLFVFMKERKTRIQVGYSMEPVITDAFSSDVVHSTIPPYFRAADYAGGLNAAIDQIARKIDPNDAATGTMPSHAPLPRSARSSQGSVANMIFPIIFVLFVLFVLLPLFLRGRRSGGCGGCGGCMWPMFLGGWGGGGGTTFGGGGGGGWSTGGSWGGGGSSFGGGGAGGGW